MRGKERDGGKEREGTEDDRRKDDGKINSTAMWFQDCTMFSNGSSNVVSRYPKAIAL